MARLQTRYGDILVVIYTGNPTTINAISDKVTVTRIMPYRPTSSYDWRLVALHIHAARHINALSEVHAIIDGILDEGE